MSKAPLKIIVLGHVGVGKSALIDRFVLGTFAENSAATIAIDYKTAKDYPVAPGVKMNVQVWDTAGQERFHALSTSYYRTTTGAMIVADVTQSESLEKVEFYLREVEKHGEGNVAVIVAFNKVDIPEENRAITKQMVEIFHQRHPNLKLYQVSALKNFCVDMAFQKLISAAYEKARGRTASMTTFARGHTMSNASTATNTVYPPGLAGQNGSFYVDGVDQNARSQSSCCQS